MNNPVRMFTVFTGRGDDGKRRRDRINDLAAEMTRQGPGKYGQPEVIDYLLRIHDDAIGRLDAALAAEVEHP